MSRIVAHFIRKSTHLKAAFINNQIVNYIDYCPLIVYRYKSVKDDGGFADYSRKDIPILNLAEGKDHDINFRYLKKISKHDLKRTLDFLKYNNVSVLHFHYGSDACIYEDVRKYSRIPSIVSFYGYDIAVLPKKFYGLGSVFYKTRLFKNITNILAMSPDMENDLLKIGCPKDKIIVHYHGINLNKFNVADRTYDGKSKIILLNIASLAPKKGHLFLLKAIQNIIKEGFRNFELRIAGKGKLGKSLKSFTLKNKLNGFVKFLEPLNYASPEMLMELKNADIFIHPSVTAENGDKEGIPGTLIEAMSSGLPVISTFHAGIPYAVNNMQTGILVNEWDINALSENIKLLINNVLLREKLGKAGQKYTTENFNLNVKEKELENIYDALIYR